MNNVIEDLKSSFRKKDTLVRLIIINSVVFSILLLLQVVLYFANQRELFNLIFKPYLGLPGSIYEVPLKFWTLFTYSFTHYDIFHVFGNMLGLYYFGQIIYEFLGSKKLLSLYIYGGLAGGILYLLAFNLLPVFKDHSSAYLVGASACVYAIVVGAATLSPDYTVFLMFLGPVRLKYLAAFFILISFAGTLGVNSFGNIAHLGGALLGFVFIKELKKGNDWGVPLFKLVDFTSSIFKRKSKLKVTHKTILKNPTRDSSPNQEEIDKILDKISASGYSSLSKEEKEKLFKASQG